MKIAVLVFNVQNRRIRLFQEPPYIAYLFAAEAMHIMTLEAMLSPENIKELKTKSFSNFYIYL